MSKNKQPETVGQRELDDARTPGTALEEVKPNALSADVYDAEEVGAGFEDMTQEDLAIPFFAILQKGSPQVEEGGAAYIEGVKPGQFFNSVTKESFDGRDRGTRFIAVHHEHKFLRWKPRDEGGGLVSVHDANDEFVVKARKTGPKFGKLEVEDGDLLAETFSVFGLLIKESGEYEPGILTFGSTQIKHYKRWMTQARSVTTRDAEGRRVTPPLYAHVYRLRTRLEQNKHGTWFGFDIRFDGPNAEACRLKRDDELYLAAKSFRDLVVSGAAKANTDSLRTVDGADQDSGDEFEM